MGKQQTHKPGALYVEITTELRAALDEYCEKKNCTIRHVIEHGISIITGDEGEELVVCFVGGSKCYMPKSAAEAYNKKISEEYDRRHSPQIQPPTEGVADGISGQAGDRRGGPEDPGAVAVQS